MFVMRGNRIPLILVAGVAVVAPAVVVMAGKRDGSDHINAHDAAEQLNATLMRDLADAGLPIRRVDRSADMGCVAGLPSASTWVLGVRIVIAADAQRVSAVLRRSFFLRKRSHDWVVQQGRRRDIGWEGGLSGTGSTSQVALIRSVDVRESRPQLSWRRTCATVPA